MLSPVSKGRTTPFCRSFFLLRYPLSSMVTVDQDPRWVWDVNDCGMVCQSLAEVCARITRRANKQTNCSDETLLYALWRRRWPRMTVRFPSSPLALLTPPPAPAPCSSHGARKTTTQAPSAPSRGDYGRGRGGPEAGRGRWLGVGGVGEQEWEWFKRYGERVGKDGAQSKDYLLKPISRRITNRLCGANSKHWIIARKHRILNSSQCEW